MHRSHDWCNSDIPKGTLCYWFFFYMIFFCRFHFLVSFQCILSFKLLLDEPTRVDSHLRRVVSIAASIRCGDIENSRRGLETLFGLTDLVAFKTYVNDYVFHGSRSPFRKTSRRSPPEIYWLSQNLLWNCWRTVSLPPHNRRSRPWCTRTGTMRRTVCWRRTNFVRSSTSQLLCANWGRSNSSSRHIATRSAICWSASTSRRRLHNDDAFLRATTSIWPAHTLDLCWLRSATPSIYRIDKWDWRPGHTSTYQTIRSVLST